MPLQETLQSIVSLQREHSSTMTPAMARRGELVRKDLKLEILERRSELAEALGRYGDDLSAEGSDGIGRKALVPWARFFSRRMSPAPTKGWYVVYLFHPDSAGVSLCLSHASTTAKDGNFQTRSAVEIEELVAWAQSVLRNEFSSDPAVTEGVELGRHRLAAAYEKTTIFSKFYASSSIPADRVLGNDLIQFGRALRKLYEAEESGLVPGSSSPDVVQILQLAEEMASPFKHAARGQGWGLDQAARTAVELQAMRVAEGWLADEGFAFQDVSSTDSCDFRATRDGENWVVEVKGTTGGPKSILVTRNEVALHRSSYPKNALLVVHGIKLGKDGTSASGGILLSFAPWLLDESRLAPTCYEYRLN
jgi:hypothetical protein